MITIKLLVVYNIINIILGASVLLIGWNFLSTNQKHYQDLGSDTSSVWNFCVRYSDIVLRGLKWRPREIAAVFSGYQLLFKMESMQPIPRD